MVTISAVYLACDPNAWYQPSGVCADILRLRVDNANGKLVFGGTNYDQTYEGR